MWISDTSIKRPVFATMVIVSFMVLGIVSLGRLGIDLFPEVNFPFVNVIVPYPGAGPEEVETLVTRPIEDAVAGINGVKRVISTSAEGLAMVGIELRLEIDPQAATAEVREKVAAIRARLPEQIKDPTINRFDVSALPIATYAVGSATLASDVTRRMVEDDIKPLLGQIDGVAAVEVNGGQVRELQVNLDPRRLEALNIPITEVAAKLAADNLDVPGGQVRRDGKAVSLRTQGQYKSASEIENVILRSADGSTVRVKDVGEVVDGFQDRTSTTRLNGEDAVSFSVRKQSGANSVEVQRKLDAALAKALPSFPQLQIKTVHTDAEAIMENVTDVRGHIIFGGIMAVLVVFVFMRDWRSTLITALALPTSVIATFFFMYAIGFTINMMTLMALSLVIGILIDDAVVVRENIYRHMEHGEDPMTAARNGTNEIGLAVMATTFTILAVFLPVGFMTGIVGQFFKSFALTIAFAVSISLLVAFTLDPMLSSRFVRFIPLEERTRTRTGRFLESVGGYYDRLDRKYHGLLEWALANPWKLVATAAVVFFASMSTLSVIGTEFVPQEDRGEFAVNIEVPAGTAFEQTVAHVEEVEQVVKEMPEVRQIFSTVGFEGSPLKASLRVKAGKKHERERGPRRAQGRHPRPPEAAAAVEDDGGRSRVHAGRADPGAAQRVPARRRHGRTAAPQRRGRAEGEGRARRGGRRQHARNRPARNGRRRRSRQGRRSRLRGRHRGDAAARHGRRHRADAAARGRQGVRHPRPAGAGVPQRLRVDRADAALLADRRGGAHPRHRAGWIRKSARRRSSAKRAAARRRSTSSCRTARSAK